MTNKRIPDLTAATTPLAGTELVPVWDSGGTKQVSVTNLTAGRAVAGTQFTASTGNFIPATSGKGVDFSAVTPAAGMTSKILSNYEEGTWTPSLTASTSGTITLTSPTMRYTRIGRMVFVTGDLLVASTSSPIGDLRITGLPFNVGGNSSGSVSTFNFLNTSAVTEYQVLLNTAVPTSVVIRGLFNGASVATVANNVTAGCGLYLNAAYPI